MFKPDQYELVDFGEGEKLERFAGQAVRRATPAAIGSKSNRAIWSEACLRFGPGRDGDSWSRLELVPKPWIIRHDEICFELRPTPFGHLGLFAEQSENWSWIKRSSFSLKGLKAINLFAYTGGTTLALASRGVEVTHVDSSRSVVNWARVNARHSGLESAPIRWIVEDAQKYVSREIKRGNQYDIVVADPPSFGRGTKKEVWKLEQHLGELLDGLASLCQGNSAMIILSCHTPDYDSARLARMCVKRFGLQPHAGELLEMKLQTKQGRVLPSGSCFRWIKS